MAELGNLDRRQALVVIGGLGAAVVATACGSDKPATTGAGQAASTSLPTTAGAGASCALAPEVTQGPYFLTDHPEASNLVGDRKGVPLALLLTVQNTACKPISGAKVDIWHCDAAGEYAGISGGAGAGGPPPRGAAGGDVAATRGNAKMWLQGYQTAGSDGTVKFDTIYPGWYMGRAVHIHMKVFVGGSAVHTGQLFFPDDLSATLFKNSPYRGNPDTLNSRDGIFASAGSAALVTPTPSGAGYSAKAVLVVKS